MRLIDADKFKQQVAAQAFTNNIPVEKANLLCKIIDEQPTIHDESKVERAFTLYIHNLEGYQIPDVIEEIQDEMTEEEKREFKELVEFHQLTRKIRH